MGVIFKIVIAVVVAVIVQQVIRKCSSVHSFAHYYSHQPGPCKKVDGIQPGSEDFHTLSNGLTFISSGIRLLNLGPKHQDFWRQNNVKGRIYLMDLNKVEDGVKELKIKSTSLFKAETFAPHGISVWEDKEKGRHVVLVINHPFEENADDRVDKFVYEPQTQELVHQTYYSDPAMWALNSIVATGANSFYFTNSNYFKSVFGVALETFLELPLTNVVHFDGQSYKVVESGLKSANGIAMSSDTQYVYVALFVSQEIGVYKKKDDNSLSHVQTYKLHVAPDNIQVDDTTGHLYVATHPIVHKLMIAFLQDQVVPLPSQVLHLHVKKGVITSSKSLFYDHGDLISGSATALVRNGMMLIGSVFDSLVTCQVNVPL